MSHGSPRATRSRDEEKNSGDHDDEKNSGSYDNKSPHSSLRFPPFVIARSAIPPLPSLRAQRSNPYARIPHKLIPLSINRKQPASTRPLRDLAMTSGGMTELAVMIGSV